MMHKALAGVVAAASLLAVSAVMPAAHAQYAANNQVFTNGPQSSGVGRSGGWSASQNVRESERYHSLLQHNRRFREARMRKECGPITDPQLHQRCLQSFAEFSPYGTTTSAYEGMNAPAYGSSTSPNYGSSYGR